jgi:hypothetical protein
MKFIEVKDQWNETIFVNLELVSAVKPISGGKQTKLLFNGSSVVINHKFEEVVEAIKSLSKK